MPQLRLEVAYAPPAGAHYAIDGFPEQQGSPLTDHADHVPVMSDALIARLDLGRGC